MKTRSRQSVRQSLLKRERTPGRKRLQTAKILSPIANYFYQQKQRSKWKKQKKKEASKMHQLKINLKMIMSQLLLIRKTLKMITAGLVEDLAKRKREDEEREEESRNLLKKLLLTI